MADDNKPTTKPAPKDFTGVSTEEMMQDFADTGAKLDTKLVKQALKEMNLPAKSDEDLAKEEKEKSDKTLDHLKQTRAKGHEKFGQEEGEKKFRDGLELIYHKLEHIRDDPDAYKQRLEQVKQQLRDQQEKGQDIQTNAIHTGGALLLAYTKATEAVHPDALWKSEISDAIYLPAQFTSKTKGQAA